MIVSSSKRAVYDSKFRWSIRRFVDWRCWMVGVEVMPDRSVGNPLGLVRGFVVSVGPACLAVWWIRV